MPLSVLDVFTIGIGPSSFHTVAPMVAALRFADALAEERTEAPLRVLVELKGSLGAAGRSHGADRAVALGLMGCRPETIDASDVARLVKARLLEQLILRDGRVIQFHPSADLRFVDNRSASTTADSIRFTAFEREGRVLLERTYHVVGVGEVVGEDDRELKNATAPVARPFPFHSANELHLLCKRQRSTIADLMWGNESVFRERRETYRRLVAIAGAMADSVDRGCRTAADLPGEGRRHRNAPGVCQSLLEQQARIANRVVLESEWVSTFAMAVAEENAAGHRVVAAPTNGVAGVVAALLRHFIDQPRGSDEGRVVEYLLTAGALGMLFRSSRAAGRLGCQGEVGAAAAMASGALTAVLGGTPEQVLAAASISLEQSLGLACDLKDGLVQSPCIERNITAAATALGISRAVLRGDPLRAMSLDIAIGALHTCVAPMRTQVKRVGNGRLAVNVVEC